MRTLREASFPCSQDCMGGCFDSADGAAGVIQKAWDREYGVQASGLGSVWRRQPEIWVKSIKNIERKT